jgi:hypothetical protein
MFDFITGNAHEDHPDLHDFLRCLHEEAFFCGGCAELSFGETGAAFAQKPGREMTKRTAILAALEIAALFA